MTQETIMALTSGPAIVLLALGVVVVILQVFMAKAESKRTGLIMPIILFGLSLAATLRISWVLANTGTFTGMVNGVMVEHATSMSAIIGQAVSVFLLSNIATGISIAIYAACRGKINRQRALEMMNVQDLG